MEYITALLALVPYFIKLMNLFIKTPAEQRADLLTKLNGAFEKAKETKGDTSAMEDIINS